MYNKLIAQTLKVSKERARLVEAYLRLQFGTLDSLSIGDIFREYYRGGIKATILQDLDGADRLAKSFGL